MRTIVAQSDSKARSSNHANWLVATEQVCRWIDQPALSEDAFNEFGADEPERPLGFWTAAFQ